MENEPLDLVSLAKLEIASGADVEHYIDTAKENQKIRSRALVDDVRQQINKGEQIAPMTVNALLAEIEQCHVEFESACEILKIINKGMDTMLDQVGIVQNPLATNGQT